MYISALIRSMRSASFDSIIEMRRTILDRYANRQRMLCLVKSMQYGHVIERSTSGCESKTPMVIESSSK
jgi:hypothetical protein